MNHTPFLPIVALVGRPNVGKSSLFNRLTKSREALVDATPGLTRDRQYGRVTWRGWSYRLVDTGGFEQTSEEPAAAPVRLQTRLAVEEADAVVFVTDARTGILADDWQVADLLRRAGKPVFCAVNKAEGKGGAEAALEFYQLGLEPVLPLSAAHGMGVDDLQEAVHEALAGAGKGAAMDESAEGEGIRTAVIGCPNAGKSTLINRLLGREQLVVSEQPGTTRDTIDVPITDAGGRRFILVDTAGIRRKSRISLKIEKFSVMAALKALDRAQVAVLTLDPGREISDQDKKIANLALDNGCGLVLAANKWDLVKGGGAAKKAFRERVTDAFPFFSHAPVVFLSAHSGQGVGKLLPEVFRVHEQSRQRIPTGRVNQWLQGVTEKHPPPRSGGRPVKIRFATQVGGSPPTLLLFCNRPEKIHATYKRYLEKQLRERFGFSGVPVRILFRGGGDNPFVGGRSKSA